LQDQIANGVVVPSKSSWASPVWLVRKKDMSVRWCIGYRRLNDSTIKDAYPLPKISVSSLTELGTFQFFTESIILGLGLMPFLQTTCPR
jgi:hypothetical protein